MRRAANRHNRGTSDETHLQERGAVRLLQGFYAKLQEGRGVLQPHRAGGHLLLQRSYPQLLVLSDALHQLCPPGVYGSYQVLALRGHDALELLAIFLQVISTSRKFNKDRDNVHDD